MENYASIQSGRAEDRREIAEVLVKRFQHNDRYKIPGYNSKYKTATIIEKFGTKVWPVAKLSDTNELALGGEKDSQEEGEGSEEKDSEEEEEIVDLVEPREPSDGGVGSPADDIDPVAAAIRNFPPNTRYIPPGPSAKTTKKKKKTKPQKTAPAPAYTPFRKSPRAPPPDNAIKNLTSDISDLTGGMKDIMGELARISARQDAQEKAARGKRSNYTRTLERFADGQGQDQDDSDSEEEEEPTHTVWASHSRNTRKHKKNKKRRDYWDEDDSSEEDSGLSRRARKSAENAEIAIPLSGVPLRLNIPEHKKVGAIVLEKWVTQYHSVGNYVNQHPPFQSADKGMSRNRMEAESWARMIDLCINEVGWKEAVTKKFMEVAVRRLMALELVVTGKPWQVAANMEENRAGYNPAETHVITEAAKQYKLIHSLTALPQTRKNRDAPAGAADK